MRPMVCFCRLTSLLLVAAALSACVQRQAYVGPPDQGDIAQAPVVAVAAGGPYAPAAGVTGYDTPYQLDAGDRLRIQVFGQEG